MNINKLRKRYFNYHRKQRRNRYLAAYKELKHEIEKESKRGKLSIRFRVNFNYEYAVAAKKMKKTCPFPRAWKCMR